MTACIITQTTFRISSRTHSFVALTKYAHTCQPWQDIQAHVDSLACLARQDLQVCAMSPSDLLPNSALKSNKAPRICARACTHVYVCAWIFDAFVFPAAVLAMHAVTKMHLPPQVASCAQSRA
jgi:hypothetical protein